MFNRIRKQKPNVMKKVIPLQGDVMQENFGLNDEQIETVREEVQIIFHFAATLRLEAKLKDAIEMNTVNYFFFLSQLIEN